MDSSTRLHNGDSGSIVIIGERSVCVVTREQSSLAIYKNTEEETGMVKSQDAQKSEKKKPMKTAKEKKKAKQEKKKG